jgi:terminase large subunit-like protein
LATAANLDPSKTLRISDFYKPWNKQILFHKMWAKHRLQVGGFGSAKSRALLMEAVGQCLDWPGANAIILRKTIPDLKRTVIDKWESDVPKSLYERGSQERGTFNKSDHIVYFPPRMVDEYDPITGELILDARTGKPRKVLRQSKLYFAACERIQDVGKYLSTEFVFVGFEELGEFPYMIYDAMEGRNRCTIPGSRPCMASATNPMGVGWGWIKRLWIDHKPVQGMDPEKYDPEDYQYVHSTVDDNPILIKDQKYVESLEKSPLREKIRWGNIETISGLYFANFDESFHVRPATDFIFQAWQPVWIGWDYGFGHYAVMTFWTKAILKALPPEMLKAVSLQEALLRVKPRMVNVMIEEVRLQEKTPEEQAAAVIATIPRLKDDDGYDKGFAWDIDSIYLSWERFTPSGKDKRGNVISVADQIGDVLAAAGLPRPSRSSTDRVAGFTRMYSMLEMGEWFILEGKCPDCVSALPALPRGDGVTCSMEDVVKPKGADLNDDCADSMRYAVAGYLLDPNEKPREQKLREKLAGITDPLARHIVAYKDYNERMAEERGSQIGGGGKIVPSWMKRVRP